MRVFGLWGSGPVDSYLGKDLIPVIARCLGPGEWFHPISHLGFSV